MHPIDNGTPGRANIAVALEKQEALAIIERLKADGIPKGDIHVVGKGLYEFANLKWMPKSISTELEIQGTNSNPSLQEKALKLRG